MDPLVVTTIEKEASDAPVLIIDRQGSIGYAIYEKIKKDLFTVFVSGNEPKITENLLHIPYKHRIPEIPNERYAMIIFIPDNEKEVLHVIKRCITKANEDSVPFIFIVDLLAITDRILEKMLETYGESYAIIVGELFGQGHSLLDKYILQAGTTRTIKLPYMGLREIHPILFDDGIHGILQIIFGIQKRHRVTFLYQQHMYSDLSIAHMMQKIDPLLHIDFLKDKKKKAQQNKELLIHGSYFFEKDYALQEKIIDIFHTVSEKRNNRNDAYIYREEIKPLLTFQENGGVFFIPDFLKIWGSVTLYCLFIAIAVPVISMATATSLAGYSLTVAKNDFEKGDILHAQQKIAVAYNSFLFEETIKAPILFTLKTIGMGTLSQQLESKITVGKEITKALDDLFVAEQAMKHVINGTTKTPDADITSLVSTARSVIVTLQKIKTDAPEEKDLIAKITSHQNGITFLSETVGLLPQLLAIKSKHTYLVLFQNNEELRPVGGFIGSYGLITFDHGKMIDIAMHAVSDADEKLRYHVDPPFAIRRFMGNVHAYLHDSNFDPDFIIDAKKATELLQIETGQQVDGVISMDLTYLKYLLSATGAVSLPDQQGTVNENNLFLLVKEQANKDKSAQKKTFLTSVFLALQKKLERSNQKYLNTVLQKSLQAIQEKHLLFALADITNQNVLTANHFSSSLWDPRPQVAGTVTDYMGISEANIGENNVNYFIKRSMKQAVSIDGDGRLKGKVQLSYQNTSDANGWSYKNYLRIILPKETTLTGIAFDGVSQSTRSAITEPMIYEAKGFVPPHELEIEQTQEQGKSLYGFLLMISAATKKTVEISYEHNQKINIGNPMLQYSLRIYKQPGTETDPFSFSFNFPLEYSILSSNPANGDGNSDYTLDTQLSEDKTIIVDLTKK